MVRTFVPSFPAISQSSQLASSVFRRLTLPSPPSTLACPSSVLIRAFLPMLDEEWIEGESAGTKENREALAPGKGAERRWTRRTRGARRCGLSMGRYASVGRAPCAALAISVVSGWRSHPIILCMDMRTVSLVGARLREETPPTVIDDTERESWK
jgi:hypothetical protein